MKIIIRMSGLFLLLVVLLGCQMNVNKSIHIRDGEKVVKSLNTVNGSIHIGSDCIIKGGARTVNGSISVGENSKVSDLHTVNSSIKLSENVDVKGEVGSVNGGVRCQVGCKIKKGISTVNGSIEIENTHVRRDVTTYNGDIELLNKSLVQGDIIIKKNKGSSDQIRRLKIYIKDNSVVEGDILVRDDDIEVSVYLQDGGKVLGKIEGAEFINE